MWGDRLIINENFLAHRTPTFRGTPTLPSYHATSGDKKGHRIYV
jgi:hypothetical protein